MNKEQLQTHWQMQKEIEQLGEQITRLENVLMSPSIQRITGMPVNHSGEADKIGKIIASLEAMTERYNAMRIGLVELQQRIEDGISKLPSEERLILRYRYIDRLTWEKIAQKTGCMSEKTARRIHAKAINNLQNTES